MSSWIAASAGGRAAGRIFRILLFYSTPSAYAENGSIHFCVHAPGAARLRVIGVWTNWEQNALDMRSTADGAYWWARVSIQDLQTSLGRSDYHGVEYQFLFNDFEKLQDPAAGWVKSSWNHDVSRLVPDR
jgi:1,4-alpha-glucan branching enzyme